MSSELIRCKNCEVRDVHCPDCDPEKTLQDFEYYPNMSHEMIQQVHQK